MRFYAEILRKKSGQDIQSLKNFALSGIFHRQKTLNHAHIQRLSKTPGPGNQRHRIVIFPPFFDEQRFIHIKNIVCNNLCKILIVKENTYEGVKIRLCQILSDLYMKNDFLKDSGVLKEKEKEYFDRVVLST